MLGIEKLETDYKYFASFKECWELHTKTKPVTQSDSNRLLIRLGTYGPFEKKSPFSQEELNVHFENNNNFLLL